jgi:8-oxo-dGTP diphosphatase
MNEGQLNAVSQETGAQDGDLVRVLAAVIREGDRYLVCRRPSHKRHGGYWEFPGGKMEAGETAFEVARRELAEELEVDVLSVGETLFSCQDLGSPFFIDFVEVQISGIPQPIEHDEIRWVTRQEMTDLKLAPSDRAFSSVMV